MTKNVVFCADGTWNGPPKQSEGVDSSDDNNDSTARITNVVKLFTYLAGSTTPESLNLRNEQEKLLIDSSGGEAQVAKYIHGVGDSSNAVTKVLGGVFGSGVIARVVRGYTFLSRSYAAGDNIYIVGFSRGAYTARALAGMVATVGLLDPATYDPNDKEKAYGLGISAWEKYRRQALAKASRATRITDALLDFVAHFHAQPLSANGLRDVPEIRAVAVWDTVGSLGLPVYSPSQGRIDVFQFADCSLAPKVRFGFHAMSLDELRKDFPVTEWAPRQDVEQVWFAGAHSDVGGGYPENESALSEEALGWMMRKLADRGLLFASPLPRPLRRATVSDQVHRPWEHVPFLGRETKGREVSASSTLHSSVVARVKAGVGYAPAALQNAPGNKSIDAFRVDATSW